jgi:polyisoprenoid-binding protein YceI
MSAVATPVQITTASWSVDPVHSSIGFGVKHLGVSTYRGTFPGVTGRIETSDGALAAVEGIVRIDSLVTADANLTDHLLAPDFFEAATYPEARFASTRIEQRADGGFRVEGELTLRGITQPVVLDGEIEGFGSDPYGNEKIGLIAKGTIDRTAFGVSWNAPLANGALALAEKVTLDFHVEGVAEAVAEARDAAAAEAVA